MPKIVTPKTAQTTSAQHAADAKTAAHTIALILSGKDGLEDHERGPAMEAASKTLEAAGCYVRRQHAKGLLIP